MDRDELTKLVNDRNSINDISKLFKMSNGSVRYWLAKYDLKTNPKLSIVAWTKETIELAIKDTICISDVLRNLGLTTRAGNFGTLQKYCKLYNLTLPVYQNQKGNRSFGDKILNDSEIFIEHSNVSRRTAKERLLKEGRGKVCEMCHRENVWDGKELKLVLDHINGVNDDHRRKNLRFLCPNCNSTLDTHCSKNRTKL